MIKDFIQKIFSIKKNDYKRYYNILGIHINYNKHNDFKDFKNLQIQNNKIVFSNSKGKRGYGCNPKYIAEEILKQNLNYELVWLVKKHQKNIDFSEFPQKIRLVEFKSKKALKELATAKFWIDNQAKIYHIQRGLEKQQGQVYIQTWHGSMGIKKIGKDSKVDNCNNLPDSTNTDISFVDYLTSNSNIDNTVFNHRYPNRTIINCGHPRNDIFFKSAKEKETIKHKIYNKYKISKNTKIILYAPTFRNNLKNNDCYNLDYFNIINAFEKKYNSNFVILTRLHHEMKNLEVPNSPKILDVTKYGDIQELMVASDVMISDYSSCMFDFMLSRKPCFSFATDLEQYNNTQGFYYPLETTPFPIATTNEEMIINIEKFDEISYKNKLEEFLKEKECKEDGLASKRVVDLIKSLT